MARLRAVPPGAQPPDDRASVALALLHRYARLLPAVETQACNDLGSDRAAVDAYRQIENDPRYIIGRLSQAVSGLLSQDLAPKSALDELLYEAIIDAVAYRGDRAMGCGCEDGCGRCMPDLRKSGLYEGLFGRLGLIGDWPSPRPDLKAVR